MEHGAWLDPTLLLKICILTIFNKYSIVMHGGHRP
ncbi:MAG: hypothetical protein RLZZ387_4967 [Chloroflexota bacterium]